FPFEQAAAIVQPSDGIDVSDEFVLSRKRPHKLDLQIAAGLANEDAIFLAEAVEQLDALLEHVVPCIATRVLQWLISIQRPFFKQGNCRILPQEVRCQSTFKGAPEEHGGA